MVSHSHARCRQCGRARHRSARFNLCQDCWKKLKPEVRAGWREIKERRHSRVAVGAAIVTEAVVPEEVEVDHQEVWDRIRRGSLDTHERADLIEEIRRMGLPTAGTPERGLYLSLFRRRAGDPLATKPEPAPKPEPEPEPVKLGRRPRHTPEQLAEIAALYADQTNSLADIKRTYGITDGTLYRAIKLAGIPKRSNVGPKPQSVSQAIAVIVPPRYIQQARWRVSFLAVREVELDAANIFDAVNQAGEQYGEVQGFHVVKVEQV